MIATVSSTAIYISRIRHSGLVCLYRPFDTPESRTVVSAFATAATVAMETAQSAWSHAALPPPICVEVLGPTLCWTRAVRSSLTLPCDDRRNCCHGEFWKIQMIFLLNSRQGTSRVDRIQARREGCLDRSNTLDPTRELREHSLRESQMLDNSDGFKFWTLQQFCRI